MIIIPVPFRRRRRRRRPPQVPSAGPGLAIVSVVPQVPREQVRVYFAGPIAWDGATTPSNFRAYTQDGFMDSPVDVIAAGEHWIEVEFNGGLDAGAAWAVVGPLDGITPAVAWPQAGAVS
jgi:hypothetical protein